MSSSEMVVDLRVLDAQNSANQPSLHNAALTNGMPFFARRPTNGFPEVWQRVLVNANA